MAAWTSEELMDYVDKNFPKLQQRLGKKIYAWAGVMKKRGVLEIRILATLSYMEENIQIVPLSAFWPYATNGATQTWEGIIKHEQRLTKSALSQIPDEFIAGIL